MKTIVGERERRAIRRSHGQERVSEQVAPETLFAPTAARGIVGKADAGASSIVRKLAELDQMAPGLGPRIGTQFLDDTRTRLAGLALALECRDADRLADLAHAVRGSAANVGADAIAVASASLEAVGRSGKLDNARSLFDEILRAFERAREELSAAGVKAVA